MAKENRVPRVYLAGGFHSGWQQVARLGLVGYECLDPSQHHLEESKVFTSWDLDAIRQSDILLANMEATNPGGYALALEIGFATALGKFIFLVDGTTDPQVKKYFEMVRQCANVVSSSLDDALFILNERRRTSFDKAETTSEEQPRHCGPRST
jgi:nucleoside 2-deoxyribosyltransferase